MKESVFFCICLVLAVTCQGRIITVDDDSPADFNTIQAAIDDSNDGDTVIVKPGTYTGDGNRNIEFRRKAITVRSTDPNDPDIVAATVVDANGVWDGFHTGILFRGGEGPNSVVDGLTIINGYGPKLPYQMGPLSQGGGICCHAGSPTIMRCIMRRNAASMGGAIYCHKGTSPTISDCIITDNRAPKGKGAGIACLYASPKISNCTIADNWAYYTGGGIYSYGSTLILTDCTFSGNSSSAASGVSDAGAIAISSSTATLTECTFDGNRASEWAGAMFNDGSTVMSHRCTFTGNWAGKVGGMMYNSTSTVIMTNCILWDGADEIFNSDDSTITISYSDIQGGWPGAGNIDVDPCFADPGYWDPNGTPEDANDDFWATGDYHLKSQAGRWDPASADWVTDDVTSLCIDAGDPMIPIGQEPFPNGGIINMGAYGGAKRLSLAT